MVRLEEQREVRGLTRAERAEVPVRGGRLGPVLWVVTLVVAVGLGVVFGRWTFVPPQLEAATDDAATVDVTEMTVGRSLPLAVSAAWEARPFGVGAASGVLTSVELADGDTVRAGDRLYSVDLRPVVAAVGEVPAFRDLTQGARGADVAQVQQLLIDAGFLTGSADGIFGPATTRAVRAWQGTLGVERDGVVRAGDVVFAVRLPARVKVAEEIAVGTRLAPGDVVLSVLDGVPEFVATIPQASSADPSLPIEVTFAGETVEAVVAGSRDDMSGNAIWTLTRVNGMSVCADRCEEVPLDQHDAVYPARQVLVPEVTGPGVPAAAVWFTAGAEPYVVLPDGTQVPVTIRGQGQGGVVLEGVEVGTTVVLPDETDGAAPAAPAASEPAAEGS
jgi:peptidoglycan hydrolase-like protein with peptidoglycan-binding domain